MVTITAARANNFMGRARWGPVRAVNAVSVPLVINGDITGLQRRSSA